MNYGERLRRKVEEAKDVRKPEAREVAEEPGAETEATPERKAPTIAELNRQSRRRQTFR